MDDAISFSPNGLHIKRSKSNERVIVQMVFRDDWDIKQKGKPLQTRLKMHVGRAKALFRREPKLLGNTAHPKEMANGLHSGVTITERIGARC